MTVAHLLKIGILAVCLAAGTASNAGTLTVVNRIEDLDVVRKGTVDFKITEENVPVTYPGGQVLVTPGQKCLIASHQTITVKGGWANVIRISPRAPVPKQDHGVHALYAVSAGVARFPFESLLNALAMEKGLDPLWRSRGAFYRDTWDRVYVVKNEKIVIGVFADGRRFEVIDYDEADRAVVIIGFRDANSDCLIRIIQYLLNPELTPTNQMPNKTQQGKPR